MNIRKIDFGKTATGVTKLETNNLTKSKNVTSKIEMINLNIASTVQDVKKVRNKDEDDYVTNSMGAFGLWQFIYVLIGSSTRSISTWTTMSVVFLAPETNFVCKRFSDNTTVEIKNNTCYDTCIEYAYTSEIFEETMISEFGLICERTWLQSIVQTILMLGVLCGVFAFGWISDRFGRSKAMIISGVTCSIFMFASCFCPDFWSIAAMRFFTGIGTGGYLALTAVYMSEIVGSRIMDIVVCSSLLTFDGAGLPIQAFFAYFSSTWRSFMIVCSSITVFMVCVTFFLPETPRWLVAKGKETEAIELMTKAAKINNLKTTNISENVKKITEQLKLKEKKDIDLTYLDLFRTKKLTIWTMASISIWFVTGFSFFGLLQYISQFGSNLYVVVTILGVAQIIAAPLSVLVVKYCSRRVSSVCIYSTIGLLSLTLIFVPKGSIAAVVIGSLGVTAASISFSVVYIIVIELYPTPMRNMGLSVSSVGSKVAAMVAPFVVNMSTKWIASSIFAAVGFSAVIFCFILPETKGKKLKDTVDDVE